MTRASVARATAADDALRTVVLAVTVAVILVFDPRSGREGVRPKELLVVTGALAAAALLAVLRAGRPLRDHPLRWPLAVLVGWTALSAAFSDHRRTALLGYPGSFEGLLGTACFAVLCVGAVEAFRRRHALPALAALWFGAGVPVLVFGVGQLLDRLLTGDRGWDWARPAISPWTIGSTLGNANHLGGFLAMLVPLGAVLAVRAEGRRRTWVLVAMGLAVVELAVTASRGAWLATMAASVVFGVLLRGRLRSHGRRVALVAGVALAIAAGTLVVLGPTGTTKIKPARLARTGPGTTLDQRFEVWGSAWRMTLDHPVVGVGPDVFTLVFPAYETERFMLLYGPFTVANGAHNLVLNTTANLGVGGLAAFVAVLASAALHVGRAWPDLGNDDRLVVAGVAAAIVAYLVQALLNSQTVTLTLCFWVLLGMCVAVASPTADEEGASL